MVLSDRHIFQLIEYDRIEIDPFEPERVEPSSVDLLLGDDFKKVKQSHPEGPYRVDTRSGQDPFRYEYHEGSVEIAPGEFVLATTQETISLPDDISANVLGRSSLGRLGISVHQTAGYIDPGFHGEITLELSNHGPAPVRLYSGDRICQIVFHELSSPADKPYGHEGSQYQGQSGATPSGMQFD